MSNEAKKPRLLLFGFKYPKSATQFQHLHRDEHRRCLSQDFDLVCITEDCDYSEMLDRFEPDASLFEAGLEITGVRRPRVQNVVSNGAVPKAVLVNMDGCSELRAAVLSDVDHIGASTLFTISVVAAEHLRGVADQILAWPNFIDDTVFYDRGQQRNVPVFIAGSLNARYPWRNSVIRNSFGKMPLVWLPHPGYVTVGRNRADVVGASYARLISASKIGVTCGSVSNELVRKHLEIPACGSVLVTEASEALRQAGFVDGVNCVLASPEDVLDKVGRLLADDAHRSQIAEAGRRLVHSMHTIRHRRQVYEWYTLVRNRWSGCQVVQTAPFEKLQVASDRTLIEPHAVATTCIHLRLVKDGLDSCWRGDWLAAHDAFAKCLFMLPEFPEAKYGMALLQLCQGQSREALRWIRQPLKTCLVRYEAADPDPVEWALLIVILICLGRRRDSLRRAREFSWLRHKELEMARWAAHVAFGRAADAPPPAFMGRIERISIHEVPTRTLDEWAEWLCSLLTSAGRHDLARRVVAGVRDQSVLASSEQYQRARGGAAHETQARTPMRYGGLCRPTLSRLDHPDIVFEASRRGISCVRAAVAKSRRLMPGSRGREAWDRAILRAATRAGVRRPVFVGSAEYISAAAEGIRSLCADQRFEKILVVVESSANAGGCTVFRSVPLTAMVLGAPKGACCVSMAGIRALVAANDGRLSWDMVVFVQPFVLMEADFMREALDACSTAKLVATVGPRGPCLDNFVSALDGRSVAHLTLTKFDLAERGD